MNTKHTSPAFTGHGRRICSPQETFDRIIKFAPVMGITRVANITGLDTLGIPVYAAHRPNARSLSVAQGKGYTCADAKTSALMEAVESYHAETIETPLRLGSYIEIACKDPVADVFNLPQAREFNPFSRLLWIEGTDLLSHEKKFVPYETVHLDFRDPLPEGHGYFYPSSTGLASGNHRLEALIHGICEVIETDALAQWQSESEDGQRSRKLDLSSITDTRCLDILRHFQNAHIHAGVWNITNHTHIPAFLCRIISHAPSDISGIRPASGIGCHPSKTVALLRALTEAAQSRLTFIAGARDDLSRAGYKKFLSFDEHKKWITRIQEKSSPAARFEHIPSFEMHQLSQDLEALLEQLTRSGTEEVISVELTKPEFGIPIIKVIIPGMKRGYHT